jgi:hypothetical protein
MNVPSLPIATAYTLCLVFGTVGIVQFAGIDIVRRAYLRWGYPAWTVRLTGGVELLAAVLLAISSARPLGVALAAGINFIAVVLLLKNRAYLLALPGIAVTAVLPLALLPTY